MKRKDVETLTYGLLKKHNLYNWTVGFQRKKFIMASCFHEPKIIKFSTWYANNNNNQESITNTVGKMLVDIL